MTIVRMQSLIYLSEGGFQNSPDRDRLDIVSLHQNCLKCICVLNLNLKRGFALQSKGKMSTG